MKGTSAVVVGGVAAPVGRGRARLLSTLCDRARHSVADVGGAGNSSPSGMAFSGPDRRPTSIGAVSAIFPPPSRALCSAAASSRSEADCRKVGHSGSEKEASKEHGQ